MWSHYIVISTFEKVYMVYLYAVVQALSDQFGWRADLLHPERSHFAHEICTKTGTPASDGSSCLTKNVAITWCIPHFCTNPKDPKSISGLRTRNNMAETRASCRLIDLSPPCVAHTIWSLRMAAINRRTELPGEFGSFTDAMWASWKLKLYLQDHPHIPFLYTSLLRKSNSWLNPEGLGLRYLSPKWTESMTKSAAFCGLNHYRHGFTAWYQTKR